MTANAPKLRQSPFSTPIHTGGEVMHFALWPALGDIQQLASRHYAFEGQCFVAAAGCVLTREDVFIGFDSVWQPDPVAREMLEAIPTSRTLIKEGGSALIAPDASYVAGPAGNERRTLHALIDLGRLAEGRMLLDTAGHYSRPDIFELRVDRRSRDGVCFSDEVA
jgi:nitrilase